MPIGSENMDFKEKMIYILVALLIATNGLWCVYNIYFAHELYNYDCNYTNTNENKNTN